MSLLHLDGVSFRYGTDAPVLRDVSFELDAGASALVIGDNGSGKSTLGRLIGGLAQPSTGAITIAGEPLARVPTRQRPSRTIYVSQVSYLQFFRATLTDEIALAVHQSGRPAPGADDLAAFSLPPLDTNPRDLTYPEMWRLQLLLLGAIFRPRVLYIDEIVAPGVTEQQQALQHLLSRRHAQQTVTLLAYQREIDVAFTTTITVTGNRRG